MAITRRHTVKRKTLKLFHSTVSHAVVRGEPTKAQLYLDSVLDGVTERNRALGRGATERERVNLAELIFYCMRKNPDGLHLINDMSGKKFTNEQILRRAVSMARALSASGAHSVLLLMRNHEHLMAAYYGALFAGVKLLLLDPCAAAYEIRHAAVPFKPCLILCEPEECAVAREALVDTGHDCPILGHDQLRQFTTGHSDSIDDFLVADISADDTAVLLLSSGSTGLPKGIPLAHGTLLARIPVFWNFHTTFPLSTEIAIFLSPGQSTIFTDTVLCCPVYGVTLLASQKMTAEHTLELLDKYQATWALLLPGLAQQLAERATASQLSSLRTLLIGAGSSSERLLHTLQEKMTKGALVCNGYGMMESGFICISGPNAPRGSVGLVLNILDYKLVDDKGRTVEKAFKNGELYLKNDYIIIKGYLNDESAYRESVTEDGWWKTGDVLYADQNQNMFFRETKKFFVINGNTKFWPVELETVIQGVLGVQECVVSGTQRGAAAAVVARDGDVTRDQIHHAINSNLCEYKRLRGGVAFVASLPRTHSGKLRRALCQQMLEDLVAKGECF